MSLACLVCCRHLDPECNAKRSIQRNAIWTIASCLEARDRQMSAREGGAGDCNRLRIGPRTAQRARIVVAPVGQRNNGSAFCFRLPLRAKSAMAEILVSNFCADCPPLLASGTNSMAGTSARTRATAAERVRAAGTHSGRARCEKWKSPIPCRFPVNRLYLQERKNLT